MSTFNLWVHFRSVSAKPNFMGRRGKSRKNVYIKSNITRYIHSLYAFTEVWWKLTRNVLDFYKQQNPFIEWMQWWCPQLEDRQDIDDSRSDTNSARHSMENRRWGGGGLQRNREDQAGQSSLDIERRALDLPIGYTEENHLGCRLMWAGLQVSWLSWHWPLTPEQQCLIMSKSIVFIGVDTLLQSIGVVFFFTIVL